MAPINYLTAVIEAAASAGGWARTVRDAFERIFDVAWKRALCYLAICAAVFFIGDWLERGVLIAASHALALYAGEAVIGELASAAWLVWTERSRYRFSVLLLNNLAKTVGIGLLLVVLLACTIAAFRPDLLLAAPSLSDADSSELVRVFVQEQQHRIRFFSSALFLIVLGTCCFLDYFRARWVESEQGEENAARIALAIGDDRFYGVYGNDPPAASVDSGEDENERAAQWTDDAVQEWLSKSQTFTEWDRHVRHALRAALALGSTSSGGERRRIQAEYAAWLKVPVLRDGQAGPVMTASEEASALAGFRTVKWDCSPASRNWANYEDLAEKRLPTWDPMFLIKEIDALLETADGKAKTTLENLIKQIDSLREAEASDEMRASRRRRSLEARLHRAIKKNKQLADRVSAHGSLGALSFLFEFATYTNVARKDALVNKDAIESCGSGIRSAISVPVSFGGLKLGLLQITCSESRAFTKGDYLRVCVMAQTVGLLLDIGRRRGFVEIPLIPRRERLEVEHRRLLPNPLPTELTE